MNVVYTLSQGRIQGGRLGAPPHSDLGWGVAPDFQNLKRKSTVTHHSNIKREKEEEGKRKKKNIVSGVMMAKETTPTPLFPPIYISLFPFLPLKKIYTLKFLTTKYIEVL